MALVAHNGTLLLFLAHLLELPVSLVWSGFYSWPASVTVILFEEHSDTWAVPRALHVADISHLYAANLEPQPRAFGNGVYEPFR
jgi:probable phosphoglycerate mutase